MDIDIAGPTRANDLLHHHAINHACARGCRTDHMGETGHDAGHAHFTTRFGARPVTYAAYSIERLPITAADDHLHRAARRIRSLRR